MSIRFKLNLLENNIILGITSVNQWVKLFLEAPPDNKLKTLPLILFLKPVVPFLRVIFFSVGRFLLFIWSNFLNCKDPSVRKFSSVMYAVISFLSVNNLPFSNSKILYILFEMYILKFF